MNSDGEDEPSIERVASADVDIRPPNRLARLWILTVRVIPRSSLTHRQAVDVLSKGFHTLVLDMLAELLAMFRSNGVKALRILRVKTGKRPNNLR
ncbi:hypothetical protein [Burkholderia ubonensis]|uniref:hypothetical protein n=1 Tax=Burkholderia ubonensis TaxID=101571 RepID=UPI0012FCAB99|nr:hypothetical protein [Burkholderia ubonensis]